MIKTKKFCELYATSKGISLDDKKEMCIPKVFENTSSVSYNYHLNNGRDYDAIYGVDGHSVQYQMHFSQCAKMIF